ncbi:MAG: VOC family protein [Thermoanaerobaculia bacterium]|nr:VOC family protein [Thermoanaerobaculia bacterium]
MAQEEIRGRFVWYDLVTRDEEAAIAFYGDLVGWRTEAFDGADKPYTMWTNGGRPLGGVMTMPEGTPAPHWMAYLGTPDVDATVARARELGAIIFHGPVDIPTVGRFAVLADPQGAIIAFFTPSTESPPRGEAQVGDFSWHELMTDDYQSAFGFYAELFGWQVIEDNDMGEMGIYRIFGRGGIPMGGVFNKPPGAPSAWIYYVTVDDVDTKAAEITAAGGQILNGPMEVPGGDRIVLFSDPQGAVSALHARAKG